jgi:pilus assembly protein CpaF
MNDAVMGHKQGEERDTFSLRNRLEQIRRSTSEQAISVSTAVEEHDSSSYYDLKVSIHGKLLDRIDLAALESIPEERLREELRLLVERLLLEDGVALNDNERRRIVVDIQNEVLGLGPLEPLLADATISDILVNTYKQVYVERYGKL